jgi:ferredoxin-NADP reductase
MLIAMHILQKLRTPLNALSDSVVDQDAINFWMQKFNPLWSVNQPLGKIVQKEQAAQDMLSLKIQVNRLFKFGEAGQHHPVYIVIKGIRYERSYSLTRLDQQHVLLNVKKVNAGKVSGWLAEQAKVGDVLEFGQPYGEMTLPQQASPLILLAAGSGITPMLSMLEALDRKAGFAAPVTLWYWVSKNQDAAFTARFEDLAQKYPNFSYQVFATQEQPAAPRLDESYLTQLQAIEQSTVYACGPSGFVAKAEQVFAAAKLFKSEAFSMSQSDESESGFVNVTLTQSKKIVSIPKGQSILVSLEQQNIKPPHGCRMGICNKCSCNKVEGSIKNLVNGAQNTEPGNFIKICVNSAQTDLVIDL